MLKAIIGSIVGGLVAGAVAIVATAPARSSTPAVAWASGPDTSIGLVDAFGSRAATAEPALVECEPNQRAELRRVSLNGRDVAQVTCASLEPPAAAFGQSDIVAAPAPAPRTIVRERVVEREPVRRETKKRSWAKSALIIGGGTGAGAGVGGLIGGKKGALIGAAVGGGSAAIFEAIKRK